MTTLSFSSGFAFGLRFTNWALLECSWAPSRFVLWIVAKSLRSCLYLFDAIIQLYDLDENTFNDFLVGSESEYYK